ncbi:MCP four helix bundle domain-containing protein [Candidatus Magnetominusculus dajiuhuensis]|uniref:MCP four helix bundle domain-containing protein n=1 Tax=Candidatus Magnetominusculus dajiuhuensis TaxID=3137712 RepID=UPI003B43A7EC
MKRLLTALQRRTLKSKLLLIFSFLLAIAFSFGIESLYSKHTMSGKIHFLYQFTLGVESAKDMQSRCMQLKDILLEVIVSPDQQQRGKLLSQLSQVSGNIARSIMELRTRIAPKENNSEENKKELADFEVLLAGYLRQTDKAAALISSNSLAQAQALATSAEF